MFSHVTLLLNVESFSDPAPLLKVKYLSVMLPVRKWDLNEPKYISVWVFRSTAAYLSRRW
jgi:hypothetical protein